MDGDGPAAREDHTWTVAEDGRTAYLFGGRDGATLFDDLWSFDLQTERWRREVVEGPPAARFGHEAAWLPGKGLVIWAGQAGADFFDDIWLLDPAGPSWKQLNVDGEAPVARYGSCSGIGPDGLLWVSHGFTANGVRFDDTWTFDLEARRWTQRSAATEKGPVKRCLHACWWTSDGRLALYGGQTNGVPALGDLWFLTPGLDDAPPHGRRCRVRRRRSASWPRSRDAATLRSSSAAAATTARSSRMPGSCQTVRRRSRPSRSRMRRVPARARRWSTTRRETGWSCSAAKARTRSATSGS